MDEEYLYIIMVGLPARGKSTIAGKLSESLKRDGIRTRIFNNGELRRKLSRENTFYSEFFDPGNKEAAALREKYTVINLNRAKAFITKESPGSRVAIIDAANVSPDRRKMLSREIPENRALFIECINEDQETLEANIRFKVENPEFAHLPRSEAIASFKKRISYYEGIYKQLQAEQNFIRVDSFNYRILKEKLNDGLPFVDRIRDFLVTPFINNLYLIRHGETYDNLEDRIGGDSGLTPLGHLQARKLAGHFRKKKIPLIFTSTLKRTLQTSIPIKEAQKGCKVLPLPEFDEINAGICENMTYSEIRVKMPRIAAARKKSKYYYIYPKGEGYVSMEKRIERGIKKVLYMSKYSENIMIVGHRAVNRMILSYFVFKRREDVPYIYIPQDRYYHIAISQNKKIFELMKFV
jgi:broad specificity phosphatase PhoE/predicted kinase